MDGQYTEDALIQGEQFGIGGWNSVRGFLEREVASDRGFSGSLEFYTPNIAPRRIGIDNLRLLIFYDAGVVLRNDPVPGDITRQSIAGAGLGLRMSVKKNLAVRVDGASVIDEGGNQQKDEIRVHFGILVSI
jgi:hemolysin activation/secretion protein